MNDRSIAVNMVHALSSTRPNRRLAALFALALAALMLAALIFAPSVALAQSPPNTPSAVTVTRGDGSITASGYAVGGATKYHITYSDDGGGSWHAPVANHTNWTSGSITFNADNAKTYIIGVRAGNDHGWSGWRNSASAGPYTPPQPTPTPTPTPEPEPTPTPTPEPEPTPTPTPQSPPAAPTGLTATAGDGSVTLAWNDPADSSITGYEYQVNHNDTGTGNLSGWSSWQSIANGTSYTVTDLTNGKDYRFKLRAVNSSGASKPAPQSAPWYVAATPQEPQPTPTPVPAPTLTTTDETTDGATITLDNYGGAWYYSVQGQQGGGGASAQSVNCNGPVNGGQTTINGLDPNTKYTITAYGNNCGGASIASGNLFTAQSTSLTHSNVAGSTATLTISGHSGNWWYTSAQAPYTGCKSAGSASSVNLTNLSSGATHSLSAHNGQYCTSGSRLADTTFTTTGSPLQLVENNATDMTIGPIAEWTGSWYYKSGRVQSNGTVNLTSCTGPVTEQVEITGSGSRDQNVLLMYADASCTDERGSIAVIASDVSLSVSLNNGTSAVFTLEKFNRAWAIRQIAPTTGSCVTKASGTTTVTFDNLTPGATYTYWTYPGNCDAGALVYGGQITFTVPKLTVTPGSTSAALTLSDWTGQWWYRDIGVYAPTASDFVQGTGQPCRGPAHGSAVAVVTGLTSGYTHGFKAYSSYKDCIDDYYYTNGNADDTRATGVLGAAPTKTSSAIGDTTLKANPLRGNSGFRIEVGEWSASDGDWWYRANVYVPNKPVDPHGANGCRGPVTGGALKIDDASLPALSETGAYHVFTVYPSAGCHYSKIAAAALLDSDTVIGKPALLITQHRDGILSVHWNAPSHIASGESLSYEVECSADNATWTSCKTVSATTNPVQSHELSGQSGAKQVRVRATLSGDTSSWRTSAIPSHTVPPAPVSVSYSGGNLTWSSPASGTLFGYQYQTSTDGGSTWGSTTTIAATTTGSITRFIGGSVNKVRIRTVQSHLVSGWVTVP